MSCSHWPCSSASAQTATTPTCRMDSSPTPRPTGATVSTTIDVPLPAAADDRPVVQVRILTTDAPGSDEWVGIDDLSITSTGVISGPAVPVATCPSTLASFVDRPTSAPVSATDADSAFASVAITSAPVDGIDLTPGADASTATLTVAGSTVAGHLPGRRDVHDRRPHPADGVVRHRGDGRRRDADPHRPGDRRHQPHGRPAGAGGGHRDGDDHARRSARRLLRPGARRRRRQRPDDVGGRLRLLQHELPAIRRVARQRRAGRRPGRRVRHPAERGRRRHHGDHHRAWWHRRRRRHPPAADARSRSSCPPLPRPPVPPRSSATRAC